ncbi:unnamed protein product [Linum trigynum]|uniref:Uncharacterized protein n=1 Tax=Linum trigynum TaxID=586398 RepID=A0AAV2D906_9ROSI
MVAWRFGIRGRDFRRPEQLPSSAAGEVKTWSFGPWCRRKDEGVGGSFPQLAALLLLYLSSGQQNNGGGKVRVAVVSQQGEG